tara:strand:+ start:4943 stop:5707 length:765 start_codon:yes stop_codon:yes gene_type:complete
MAIQSNSSEVQVTGGGIPLFTGIAPVSVIAVNPNLGELHSLGINMKTEPSYSGIQLGENVKNKIVFWVKNDEHSFSTRVELFVEDTHRAASKTGKYQITNKYGQVTWAETPESAPDWFKKDAVRRMYPGEEALIGFVKAWANIPSEGECSFDTIDDIVKGDVSEMKTLVTQLKDNKLRVMLGVKDEKYQQVYTRHFGRLKPATDRLFIKALNDEYGSFNAEYNDDLLLQKYDPELVKPTQEEAVPVSDGGDSWL